MQAFRLITEPVARQLVIDLPPALHDKRLEVIVLPASEQEAESQSRNRQQPDPRLKGTVSMHDDLVEPACPEKDWNALS